MAIARCNIISTQKSLVKMIGLRINYLLLGPLNWSTELGYC